MICNVPGSFKTVQICRWYPIFQTVSKKVKTIPDGFKTVWLIQHYFNSFMDSIVLSRYDLKFSRRFLNRPDICRWYQNLQTVSKLSAYFQVFSNFPDVFNTVEIFPDDTKLSRNLCLKSFGHRKKLSGKFWVFCLWNTSHKTVIFLF